MALVDEALIRAEKLAAILSLTLDGDGQPIQTEVEDVIGAVSQAFAKHAGNRVFQHGVSITETATSYDGRAVYVKRFPIESVTRIDWRLSDGTIQTISTNVTFDSEVGIIYTTGQLPWPTELSLNRINHRGVPGFEENALRVIMTSGWVTPQQLVDNPSWNTKAQLPLDIQEAVLESCVKWYQTRRQRSSNEIRTESVTDNSVTYSTQEDNANKRTHLGLLSHRAREVAETYSVSRI